MNGGGRCWQLSRDLLLTTVRLLWARLYSSERGRIDGMGWEWIGGNNGGLGLQKCILLPVLLDSSIHGVAEDLRTPSFHRFGVYRALRLVPRVRHLIKMFYYVVSDTRCGIKLMLLSNCELLLSVRRWGSRGAIFSNLLK
uniref:Putative secreted protein n=1 Tax=Anopheles darlingi TaxID=43151 RepID=A0A2M4DQ19_ANODA